MVDADRQMAGLSLAELRQLSMHVVAGPLSMSASPHHGLHSSTLPESIMSSHGRLRAISTEQRVHRIEMDSRSRPIYDLQAVFSMGLPSMPGFHD